MVKTHLKIHGTDCREQGQTEFEYAHQAACGYVRDSVTDDSDKVDCKLCLMSSAMKHKPAPKFENVSCSRCGKDFGPGNSGFSDCESHKGIKSHD